MVCIVKFYLHFKKIDIWAACVCVIHVAYVYCEYICITIYICKFIIAEKMSRKIHKSYLQSSLGRNIEET